MRIYFLCSYLVCCLFGLQAAPRWRWSNPLPHGNNVNDMTYKTNWGYVQVCDQGQIYVSTDAVNWTRRDLGFREQLRSAVIFGNRFVAAGESGRTVWSEDLITFNTVNLDTSNWIEGLSASTNQIVGVGDNGSVYTSDTGTNWVRRLLPASQQAWFRSTAWGGTTPGFFVVVGENSTVLTSADGISWTKRTVTSSNGAHLNRVTWTGGGFVAVGDSGTVIFGNASGTSWVRQLASGATGDLNAVSSATNSIRLVAGDQEARIASVWGGTVLWSSQTSSSLTYPAPIANYLSALWDGDSFLLGGPAGLLVYGASSGTSGVYSWTPYSSPTRNWLFDLSTATATGTNITVQMDGGNILYTPHHTTNTFYVASGDRATILTSDDGLTWSSALVPATATNRTLMGIASNSSGLVSVGSGGTIAFSPVAYAPLISTNRFTNNSVVTEVVLTNWYNTLGLAWYASTSPTSNDLQAATASASRYVIGGAKGFLATSETGTNWTQRVSGTTQFLSGLETYSDGFVAVGDGGTIITSPDGQTWTHQKSGTSQWLYRVRAANNLLVAVGANGTIVTSPDGTIWTTRSSGVTNWLNDVEYTSGQWYAVGNQGTLLISTDAITWTQDTNIITGKSLYAAAAINGQLITAGVEGVILRARVSAYTEPVSLTNYPKSEVESLFLFTGSADQPFRLERSTDLLNWESEGDLEIPDTGGALLHLSARTNSTPQQWFRTIDLQP